MSPEKSCLQPHKHFIPTEKADVFLRGGTVLNVYSGELLKMNVAITGERFSYVGPNTDRADSETMVLDVEDKVLVPGYVEPHCHPWLLYNPLTFGEEACRLGTTTFFCDNLVYYSLMGVDAFESFMDAFSQMPVKYFWTCRAVPQTPVDREDEIFSVENIGRLLKHPSVASLGEITRWQELAGGNPKITQMIELAKSLKKRVDGHTAGAKYEKLNPISGAGVASCHESISGQEVLDRLRLGLHVMLRESSLRQDLKDLLEPILKNRLLTDRLMLTTDSSSPSFYEHFGVTNHLIEIAVKEGMDPLLAYRMTTINPAVYFGMDQDIGGIAPGRYADVLVLTDLLHPTPEVVFSKGRIVAESSRLTHPFPSVNWRKFFPESSFTDKVWYAKNDHFKIPYHRKSVLFPTIKLISTVITRLEWVELGTKDGFLDLDAKDGCCLLALISKDGRWVTNGVLQGIGRKIEGLASSFNTAAQILVMGRDPEAMAMAVNRVLALKGGIVAVEDGKTAYELALPLGGMVSDAPMHKLAEKDREFQEFLFSRGYPFHDPLYTLIFLPNDFLPDVRINYNGVVDIKGNNVLWERRNLT